MPANMPHEDTSPEKNETGEAPTSPQGGATSAWLKLLPLLAAFGVFLTFIPFPAIPPGGTDGPVCDADASLNLLLTHLHDRGAQFGTEHVYTYGPLGFLVFFLFAPEHAGMRMVVDVLLGIAVSTGLCLLASRMRVFWRWLLLGSYVWIASNIHPRTELVINTGLLCFGLLCFVETGRRLAICAAAVAGLAAFSALAKNSFLFVMSLSVVLIAFDLILRGRRRVAFGVFGGFAGAFLLGWVLSGQHLVNLWAFVTNVLAIMRGYNAALGWEASLAAVRAGSTLAVLLPGLLAIASITAFEQGEKVQRWRRGLLLTWLLALAFAAWKHGFVRAHEGHLTMFFGFVAVLAIALQVLSFKSSRAARWRGAAGLACFIPATVALQTLFFQPMSASLTAPFRAAVYNLKALANPPRYLDHMRAALEAQEAKAQLPGTRETVGEAPVDVFGQEQAYALFNHLNYHARPVPQSYAVCNAQLMRINEQFYLSQSAPEYVLFELNAIDRKFPPLEDAWVLRDILINYDFAATEEPFVILKRRATDPARLRLVRTDTVRPGQRFLLGNHEEAALWVEIDLEPSFAGRLRQFFVRPPVVRLSAWGAPGGHVLLRGRAPASMLGAGFLARPLLSRTKDVVSLYKGEAVRKPGAYSIDMLPGEERYWKSDIRVRIYRIENRLGSNS